MEKMDSEILERNYLLIFVSLTKNMRYEMYRVKYLTVEKGKRLNIDQFPNFDRSGSIKGMKKLYYGKDALLVRCGKYIYNVTSKPGIYDYHAY